ARARRRTRGRRLGLRTRSGTPQCCACWTRSPKAARGRVHLAGHGMMGAVTWKAPDVKRPEGPLAGPERPMLQAFLDWHRATLLYKCAGLTGEQMAGQTVPPSGLSLLGLVRHMTKV